MITVLLCGQHAYTIEKFLASSGAGLAGRMRPLAYERALRARSLPAGTFVFTDVDRLSTARRRLATRLADTLLAAGSAFRVLNHPRRFVSRHGLLSALHADGSNPFGVYRIDQRPPDLRFPVFLRMANDHQGDRGGLLESEAAIEQAAERQRRRGKHRHDMLLVEYVDTRDAQQRYRKYGAFRVGDRIVARHLFFGPMWMLKGPASTRPDELEAEYDYVSDNPHAGLLRPIFDQAGVVYGRMDYTLHEGRICVFEVNTNPMISMPEDVLNGRRADSEAVFATRFREAWEAVDLLSSPGAAVALPRLRRRPTEWFESARVRFARLLKRPGRR